MLRYLATFLTAAETGSFSSAGERLGLTQSAVSMQIKRLESDLGCLLFERSGKAVQLSERGRALISHARDLVARYDDMKAGAAPQVSTINLGAISTVQSGLLPKALGGFFESCPATQIQITPGTSIQLLAQVDAGELDIAAMIKPNFGIPANLVWIPLLDDVYVAVAPKAAMGSLREWALDLPFIRYDRRSYGGGLVNTFLRRQKLMVREGIELDEPAVIAQMVAEGLGWSVVPGDLLMLRGMSSVQRLTLPGQPVSRKLGLLVRKAVIERATTRALVENLQNEARMRRSDAAKMDDAPVASRQGVTARRPRIKRADA
ncbi:LysR family transcriptional regulator [Caballeronia sordidicola]|jgi:DNA-binding transcriptional LysR family regulator|uniref:Transcriptional regulator, LysR family n=1 Tax=Caballeronia sordidicola TaxID=196367 RepID=A0A242N2D0_CABSO|nr:LysR family transcriptional regulator [Caballeronia sordidicola]OTP77830.1 Transcriptional regulator, LysR family [Caballeronia sordidicola]